MTEYDSTQMKKRNFFCRRPFKNGGDTLKLVIRIQHQKNTNHTNGNKLIDVISTVKTEDE